jgi:hypothetical protein
MGETFPILKLTITMMVTRAMLAQNLLKFFYPNG